MLAKIVGNTEYKLRLSTYKALDTSTKYCSSLHSNNNACYSRILFSEVRVDCRPMSSEAINNFALALVKICVKAKPSQKKGF